MAGAQRSLLAVLPLLRQYGVEPIALAPAGGIFVDAVRRAGIDVRILDAPPAYHTFGKRLLKLGPLALARTISLELAPYAVALHRFFSAEGVSVVHANTPRGMLGVGPGAKLGLRATVLHLRGTPGFGGPMWLAAQALSDRVVLVANALLPSLAPRYRARASVVYNGAAPPQLVSRESARVNLAQSIGALREDELVVLSLSSPVPFKGLHVLFDAAKLVAERGVHARYVVAGAGAHEGYERWLARRADALGIAGSVHMMGHVADPFSLLAASDMLVLPSVDRCEIDIGGEKVVGVSNEGFPRSVLEAMFSGVPPIATRIAGTVEQITHGESGMLVAQNDASALCGAILELATDDDLRTRISRCASAVARERFSLDAAALGLARVLRDTPP